MNTKSVIATVVVLGVVLVGFLWLEPLDNEPGGNEAAVGALEENSARELTVDHTYANGTHTIEGSMDVPTPCHEVIHEVIHNGDPKNVTINLRTESTAEICTQVIANKLFSISFPAPEDARITAILNGEPIKLRFSDIQGSAIEKL